MIRFPFVPALPALSLRQIIGLALTAALALTAIVQTIRVEGFRIDLPVIGQIGPQGWKPRAIEAEKTVEYLVELSRANRDAQREQKQATERALAELAKETDNAIEQAESERERARRFIAAGGLRSAAPACRGSAPAPAGDHRAGISPPVRSAPQLDDAQPRLPDAGPATVAVLPADVGICTDNTILAEQWRAYILKLEASSRAAQRLADDAGAGEGDE